MRTTFALPGPYDGHLVHTAGHQRHLFADESPRHVRRGRIPDASNLRRRIRFWIECLMMRRSAGQKMKIQETSEPRPLPACAASRNFGRLSPNSPTPICSASRRCMENDVCGRVSDIREPFTAEKVTAKQSIYRLTTGNARRTCAIHAAADAGPSGRGFPGRSRASVPDRDRPRRHRSP